MIQIISGFDKTKRKSLATVAMTPRVLGTGTCA
jgi:hypothetical protein